MAHTDTGQKPPCLPFLHHSTRSGWKGEPCTFTPVSSALTFMWREQRQTELGSWGGRTALFQNQIHCQQLQHHEEMRKLLCTPQSKEKDLTGQEESLGLGSGDIAIWGSDMTKPWYPQSGFQWGLDSWSCTKRHVGPSASRGNHFSWQIPFLFFLSLLSLSPLFFLFCVYTCVYVCICVARAQIWDLAYAR